ncbi:MAG: DUF4411 family protein [Spirochaetales bacterium]|nr:DUF4411 family protein [Spirochaetales bacterium]
MANEIEAGNDELTVWASKRGDAFFLKPDDRIIPAFGKTSAWAQSQSYEPSAVSTFFQVADYYLVAHALAHGDTIVTHEIPQAAVKKIKIPNACIGLGVKCMSPFEMLRLERARFVLQA